MTTMAVTEYGIVYAVHIVTVQFGSVVAKVCECLLRKGALTARDISRFTEVNHNQVKDILYLLIQHNCVQAFAVEQPGAAGNEAKITAQFIVMFSNILHRMRYNKFMKIVKEELGQQCGEVLEGLLSNGRLTLGQLVERDGENGMGSDVVRDSLQKLIAARYVERIPAPEPVLGAPTEEESAPKKRGSKSAKIIEVATLEERVLEAATPVEAIRFPLILEQESNSSFDNDGSSPSGNISGVKRKHGDADSNVKLSDSNNQLVWRPSFEGFIHRLRHKACVEIVKDRKDDKAAIVLGAMLEITRYQEKKVKVEKSAPVSIDSIFEEVIKSEAGRNMTMEHVGDCLDQLCSNSTYLPAFVVESGDSYVVDFKSIIGVAQKDEIESVVLRRYGKDACRMFRYLSQEGRLVETDKIADAALSGKKDTPKILLKMWKDEYLHMEKLVVAGRYIPFLLWKVNQPILWRRLLDEMFHASLNLSLRLNHELDQEKELLSLPLGKLEGKLKERLNRIKEKRLLLSCSRFKLDDSVMFFHDF
ncbi:PREDICTED: uncharacterized protein LOC104818634 [Tarenaya hassleriana]|uniref:uncharacterized protein LOC104818634 n=1 Tax=Tarenaya hassleriana TaxID=28532 RepID=UPI00053C8B79|nr:PREDICTED: uncharacterized protein LOC104818634 [Tarenaya hassleriana]